jgi:RHS repeat-associated protein
MDPDHNTTSFAYDADGRKTSMTDPLGHTSTWAYDADGNVISATDRDGRTITSQYDADGALVLQTLYGADGSVLDTLTFTYDADGNLLTAANSQGAYSFSYDGDGHITSVQEPFGLLLSFTYDADGNRVQVSDSLVGAVNSVYDAAGQLVSRTVSDPSGATGRIDLAYDQAGYLTRLSRFADLAATQLVGATINGYDAAGRIGSIVHQNGSGATLHGFNYTFDVAGQLTSETDAGVVTNYSYDASSQLTGAGNKAYSYDANGNPTNAGDVMGAGNQLLSDGTWNYTYDNEGNLVRKIAIATGEQWVYGYDDHNQLVSAVRTAGDGTLLMNAAYRYDVFGNRLEKDVWTGATGTVVTRFAYDGWKNGADAWGRTASTVGNENWDVWADLDPTGSLTTRYLRGDVVDQVFAQVPAGAQIQWLLTDHLGSVRELTSAAGVNLNHVDYDAFGNIVSQGNGLFGSRYAYTGREIDPETGLEFERGRYYDPHTGRWTSEDPLGFDASDANLYRYVHNQPTATGDPSGLVDPRRKELSRQWRSQARALNGGPNTKPTNQELALHLKADDVMDEANWGLDAKGNLFPIGLFGPGNGLPPSLYQLEMTLQELQKHPGKNDPDTIHHLLIGLKYLRASYLDNDGHRGSLRLFAEAAAQAADNQRRSALLRKQFQERLDLAPALQAKFRTAMQKFVARP